MLLFSFNAFLWWHRESLLGFHDVVAIGRLVCVNLDCLIKLDAKHIWSLEEMFELLLEKLFPGLVKPEIIGYGPLVPKS